MRTTLAIDDDVLKAAQSLARERGVTLGAAVSELARLGLRSARGIRVTEGIPTFEVSEQARPFTDDDVRAIEDEPQ
ncbi:MAG TPA: antitoxin [Spirochaetia bacterium]|nr:antitoxin [Spirochaetia bacterium]